MTRVFPEAKLVKDRFPWESRTLHPFESVAPWCREHFGAFNDRWYRYGTDIAQGIVVGADFYDYYRFQDEQDAMLFQLRWGG
jgi:hypothetical protein